MVHVKSGGWSYLCKRRFPWEHRRRAFAYISGILWTLRWHSGDVFAALPLRAVSSFLVHQPGAHRPVSAGASRSCRFTLFPCFRPFFFRPPRVSLFLSRNPSWRAGVTLSRDALLLLTVAIIYRSPFSAQVIPAKIVASVNYYYATSLHLWISIVPRNGDLLLLRIIPVKRGKTGEISRATVTVQSFRLKD